MADITSFLAGGDVLQVLMAVQEAEAGTSAKIRIHIEASAGADAWESARRQFINLGLRKNKQRNNVLFYLAVQDKKLVVLADDGIFEKVQPKFWNKVLENMIAQFKENKFAQGIIDGAKAVGEQLAFAFPQKKTAEEELPDAISYGKEPEKNDQQVLQSDGLAAAAMLIAASIAAAEIKYPARKEPYANDFAKVISKPDLADINRMFKDLDQKKEIEAVVVTIKSVKNYTTEETEISDFASKLYKDWRVGDARKGKGLLLLVAVNDKTCSLVFGDEIPGRFDFLKKNIPKKIMIPYFKVGDYSRGIFEGSRETYNRMNEDVSFVFAYKSYLFYAALMAFIAAAIFSFKKKGRQSWIAKLYLKIHPSLYNAADRLVMMVNKGKGIKSFGEIKPFGGGAAGGW